MNFSNTWRNYIKTSGTQDNNLLIEQFLKEQAELILENRINKAKEAFPDVDNEIDQMAKILQAKFGRNGPKYLMYFAWARSTYGYSFDEIVETLELFHQKGTRLSPEKRNIDWWRSDKNRKMLEDLKAELENLPTTRKEKKKKVKTNRREEIFYEEKGILGVVPFNKASSCYRGRNPARSTWCISHKGVANMFTNYLVNQQQFFAFIIFDEKMSAEGIGQNHPFGQICLHYGFRPCPEEGESAGQPFMHGERNSPLSFVKITTGANREVGERNQQEATDFLRSAIVHHIGPDNIDNSEAVELASFFIKKGLERVTANLSEIMRANDPAEQIRVKFEESKEALITYQANLKKAEANIPSIAEVQKNADADCKLINDMLAELYARSQYASKAIITCEIERYEVPGEVDPVVIRGRKSSKNRLDSPYLRGPDAAAWSNLAKGVYGEMGGLGDEFIGNPDGGPGLADYLPNWENGKWKPGATEQNNELTLKFVADAAASLRSGGWKAGTPKWQRNLGPNGSSPEGAVKMTTGMAKNWHEQCWFFKKMDIWQDVINVLDKKLPNSDLANIKFGAHNPFYKGNINCAWSVTVTKDKFMPKREEDTYNKKLFGCLRTTDEYEQKPKDPIEDAIWEKLSAEFPSYLFRGPAGSGGSSAASKLVAAMSGFNAVANYTYKIFAYEDKVTLTATSTGPGNPRLSYNKGGQPTPHAGAYYSNKSYANAVVDGHVICLAPPQLMAAQADDMHGWDAYYSRRMGGNPIDEPVKALSEVDLPPCNYHAASRGSSLSDPTALKGATDIVHILDTMGRIFESFLVEKYATITDTWNELDPKKDPSDEEIFESNKDNFYSSLESQLSGERSSSKQTFYEQLENQILNKAKSDGRLLGEHMIWERKMLSESRKRTAKGLAPIADHFGAVDVMAQQLRTQFGDKGMAKYIIFGARELEEIYKQTYAPSTGRDGSVTYKQRAEGQFVSVTRVFEEIMGAIMQFHTVQNRLDQKDINKYTLQSLRRTIDNLPESETARKKSLRDKAEAEKNSELVYNKNGIMAVRPLTTQASCFFGHNPRLTTWCISTKSKRNYFDQYTKEESKAFVFVRFFGIPEDDPSHIISMQWSGPGEPEFEMYWDAPNEAQNPDDLYSVVQQHVEGMYPEEEESWEDLTQELHDALYSAAQDTVFDNPPDDPIDAITPKCEAIEAAFDEKSEYTNLWWEIDQDTFQEDGYVGVYFGAKTEIQLEPEDYNIPAEVIDDPKLDYSFWRQIEKRWEETCKKGGLYVFEEYELYPAGQTGAIVLEMKHEADTTIGGYTLEGFEEFARDTLEIEQEDAVKSKELAIAILQEEFSQSSLGLPAEDEQGLDNEVDENMFYKQLERELLGEEKGRSRQRGIYKFHCMIAYGLTTEGDRARGLDDILADLRALPNVTIVTVAIRNQKIAEGRYIAGLAIKFIPSVPGNMNQPEQVKARIVRDIKRLENVQSLFKLSTGLIRIE